MKVWQYMRENNSWIYEIGMVISLLFLLSMPIVFCEISIAKIASCVLYALPMAFFVSLIKKKILYVVFLFLLTIASFMETIMTKLYGNYINSGNILAVLNTNLSEGSGFIKSALYAVPYCIPVFVFAFCAFYLYKGQNHTKEKLIGGFFSFLLSVVFVVLMVEVKWDGNLTYNFYVTQNVLTKPPYNFFYQAYNTCRQIKVKSYIGKSKNFSFGATRPSNNDKEIYVMAIGETLRYDNLSIAGYKRLTTPLLAKQKNLTLFSNYYSTATLTMYSVPQIITRATASDFELNYKEKSIVEPFKECGFKTVAICCKNLLIDERYLTYGVDEFFNVKKDHEISKIIDSLSNLYPKIFFVIQFWGSHGPYDNLRPEDIVFKGSSPVDAYDNTIRYTDCVVTDILRVINRKETQSTFLMVSDHGEDHTPGRLSGHGSSCNPSKEEYHVPLIFWCSDKWKKRNEEKAILLNKRKHVAVNADNVFYSVCDMANIRIDKKYSKDEWSIFSSKFKTHDRYLLLPDGVNTLKVE